ncbi:ribonuclease E/G [Telmatospirillum siberiense]|nr:ribonuclease E/G [Telmatospirillum siberiense]
MPPVDEILFSRSPGESRFALMAGGVPVEFVIDRGAAGVGAFVLGRVLSVNRGLDAAFVDIGEPLPGFLASPGAAHGEGAVVLVQVTAASRGSKGAALSAQPSMQGSLLVYTPARPGLNLSRRIADDARREGLRTLLRGLLEPHEGLVVRTEAAEADEAALLAELTSLRGRWRSLSEQAAKAAAPARLLAVPPLAELLAAHPRVAALRVDDRAALAEAKALFPAAIHEEGVFDREAGEALDQALDPRVPLPGGGSLIIETTAAYVTVDIDSGGGAPLAANLAAVPEIARQLRLRGLAGHILIDIIPLKDRQAQARLLAALRKAVADDPTPTHVVGVTPLGSVEMTRERRRPSLAELLLDGGAPTRNAETLGLEGLRAALRAAFDRPQARIALAAAPGVAALLSRNHAALDDAARRLGRPLPVRAVPDVATYQIIEEP